MTARNLSKRSAPSSTSTNEGVKCHDGREQSPAQDSGGVTDDRCGGEPRNSAAGMRRQRGSRLVRERSHKHSVAT